MKRVNIANAKKQHGIENVPSPTVNRSDMEAMSRIDGTVQRIVNGEKYNTQTPATGNNREPNMAKQKKKESKGSTFAKIISKGTTEREEDGEEAKYDAGSQTTEREET